MSDTLNMRSKSSAMPASIVCSKDGGFADFGQRCIELHLQRVLMVVHYVAGSRRKSVPAPSAARPPIAAPANARMAKPLPK